MDEILGFSDERLLEYMKEISLYMAKNYDNSSLRDRIEAGVMFACAGFEAIKRGLIKEPLPWEEGIYAEVEK